MAGSWHHATTSEGKLLRNEDIVQMLENGGDWYEFAEEAYGMVWYLASVLSNGNPLQCQQLVESARKHYQMGISASPGLDGTLAEKG